MKTVLFVSDAWGYGTTTVLIAIADRLDGCRRVFAGTGASLELAARGGFDDIRDIDVAAPDAGRPAFATLREAAVVVDCMNVAATHACARAARPCAFVDGLAWMWDGPFGGRRRSGTTQRPGPSIVRYFVERFPGVEEKLERWKRQLPPFEVVGPIIVEPERTAREDLLLVNLGGMRSWLMPEPVCRSYAVTTCRVVARALDAAERRPRVVVASGEPVARHLRDAAARPGWTFVSLPHAEYLATLARAEFLVTAAGLRAIYEAFAHGVPTALLLPQNLSQEATIRELGHAGAAGATPTWQALFGLAGLETVSQPEACAAINDAIVRLSGDEVAVADLAGGLAAFFRNPGRDRAAQRRFFASLGDNGAGRIAEFTAEVAAA